jgi:hypothetical protein
VRGSSSVVACGVLAALCVAVPARAQRPTSKTGEYSPYEKEAIQNALKEMDLEIDRSPEDKIIGRVIGVRLEVLEPRDPGPELLQPIPILSPLGKYITKPMLNWLHVLTKEWIIQRELLVHEGDPYVQVLVDETARNMRSRMPVQVSLVVIVPVKSKEPGKVDILVITKDIWSLRLSFDIAYTPGGLENLVIVPQETNFLGQHHTAQTRFQLRPESYTLGIGYNVPRFGYSWIGAGANASITINRRTGAPEGSSVGLSAGQSLYSTRTDWAWATEVSYSVGVARRYSNAHVFEFDSRLTPAHEAIPWEYKTRDFGGSASVTRSFGWALKNNFSLSFNASTTTYEMFDIPGYDPNACAIAIASGNPVPSMCVAVLDFQSRALPVGESRVYPSISWSTFATDFLRTLDINTLALQEDYRLGHNASVSLYPVTRALGSTRDLVGVSAKAGYTIAMGDGLAGANVSTFAEVSDGVVTDGSVGGSFGAVTPRFGVGRLLMNTSYSNRYKNYLNQRSFIGGEDRLRGYPTAFFAGKDTVFFNMEYRSRAIEILKAQIGGVLFYDAGDAADGVSNFQPKQSVGFGIRTLFPQVNRLVFRFDFAFPLNRGPFPETGSNALVPPFGFFFAFDQAFAP